MKRKEVEEVYDDFAEFSLSSPARKIRRLDAELPRIMEEEPLMPLSCDQQVAVPMESAVPSTPAPNEERALVLYKPVNTPIMMQSSGGSSNFTFKVHPDLISGLKNQVYWPGGVNSITEVKDEEERSMNNGATSTNSCLAVVPWVPQQHQAATPGTDNATVGVELAEPMAIEAEGDASTMEIEGRESGGMEMGMGAGAGEGLQQWQQHCMTPQLPQNTSTPIMWSW